MKKHIKIILIVLVCTILLGGGFALIQAESATYSETNAFVSNYYIGATDQKKPFFDVILPEIAKNIKANNKHTLTPYYDAFPVANNPENFQGLGSTTYANINGQTVTAEAFLRLYGESLHDPNAGMGLLIYQSIQYKRAHPTEDVKITFSSYRTSVTASVCVIPESKYYGYMRSLYGTNYDEHGFVRISYMLAEAARMGIEVTMVNQLNSYGVNQYNPTKKAVEKRNPLSYKTYFAKALVTDCYDKYAKGKKVSDFMNFCAVEWEVDDKTTDMQHLKSCTVSHYLATDGTEHKNAVFFTSSNLDENDYKGRNGNGLAQSGVIISDHEDLYRVTYNYTLLMTRYDGLEEIYELQDVMRKRNEEQIAMLRNGQGSMIPRDEQIVYVGGENDPVFELYFTPFGGGMDIWDKENNAFCNYMDKMAASGDYVEYAFNVYGYGKSFVGETMEDMVAQAFCDNPDPRNKIFIRVTDFDTTKVKALKMGTQIGFRDIGTGNRHHTKDMLLNYAEDGVRHRVTLMSSCNSYPLAFNLRTNSLLVINETDASGGNFYGIYGDKFAPGMISNDLLIAPGDVVMEAGQSRELDVFYRGSAALTWTSSDPAVATVSGGTVKALKKGVTVITATNGTVAKSVKVSVADCAACAANPGGLHTGTAEQYIVPKNFAIPQTFEAEFTLDKDYLNTYNTLLGCDDNFGAGWAFALNKTGKPRILIRQADGLNTYAVYVFSNVDLAIGQRVHLTITTDIANKQMHCYVNGELAQTITIAAATKSFTGKYLPIVGGDYRSGNAAYFPGTIHSVSAWSDVRSASEVAADYTGGVTFSDKKLLLSYDFDRCESCRMKDLSSKKNDLTVQKLWLEYDEVAPVTDFAYSFAVVGDTQTMCEKDPAAMGAIYDWLLEKKDELKIQYVLGMGDITDDSTDGEWEHATGFISKLDGKIPYSLCRGNHDDWDDFNRHFHNGFYETTVGGMMVSGDVDLCDPKQPGLIENVLPDGTVDGFVTREGDVPEGGIVKGDLTNTYRTIEVSGTKYLIMTLDFAPNSAMLKWADGVIAAHPDHKVIVTTHAYMYRDGTTLDAGDCYPPTYYTGYTDAQNGDDMWNKLLSKHKNILLVISGHDPWQHIVYRQDKGVNGNTVTQLLVDAQYTDYYAGSTGSVAMLFFSKDGKTMTVRYYAVAMDCYGSELSQFTVNLQ